VKAKVIGIKIINTMKNTLESITPIFSTYLWSALKIFSKQEETESSQESS